ncbi:hypothetical protein NDU88_003774 [Pleurodeles waltl]|uniref:Uncharacterized protein n=1 Tax=Pleurodeles waltl TaxID=8319 RepID=A0AAV7MRN9_PLEWA|nr:hypothetical protein NDU88_003774 [Pleurodeles waltl]
MQTGHRVVPETIPREWHWKNAHGDPLAGDEAHSRPATEPRRPAGGRQREAGEEADPVRGTWPGHTHDSDKEIRMDRVQRVGPPQVLTAIILACLYNFPLKERIVQLEREQHPLKFCGYTMLLYQDFAALTLQKRRDIRPITSYLRDKGVTYSWGYPFRLIFQLEGKPHHLSSLKEAYKRLRLEDHLGEHPHSPRPDRWHLRHAHWLTVLTVNTKPDLEIIASEKRAVLESLVGDMKKSDGE